MNHLEIHNFGPLADVDVEFGDLTFFVGPQASGKSLALESLKLIQDRDSVIDTLDRYNYIIGHNARKILNVYYGEGMDGLWKDDSILKLDDRTLTSGDLSCDSSGAEPSVFYVPAQRIVCMGDGFPKFFSDFSFTTPYVLREFTETLRAFVQFGLGDRKRIFPIEEEFEGLESKVFDTSIFNSGEVEMAEVSGQKKMLLSVEGMKIPFMAWSTGQKEFMPLLLAFYCLSGSPANIVRRGHYSAVIIEEPEMGLHPKAIVGVLLQIIGMMVEFGYKVIISTHSSVFLEFAWAFNVLKGHTRHFHEALCDMFEVSIDSPAGRILGKMKDRIIKTYYFSRNENGKVETTYISSLDVDSEELSLSEWGGLAEFASRMNDVVSKYLEYSSGQAVGPS